MNSYRADLHVHTVLSPCGDLEMSPANIVEAAARNNIDILGITDHNSTRHAALIKKLAKQQGIFVLCGAEVTTKEEIHCLAFFENNDQLMSFQKYLEEHLADVKNHPELFGHQVVLNEEELIVEKVDKLLVSALDQTIDEVEATVHALGGLFIPAHINRPSFSLFSQLGFVPPGLKADALELSKPATPEQIIKQFPDLSGYTFIRSSDAHHPIQLGSGITVFEMKRRSFSEIRKTLKGVGGRKVWIG